MKALAQVFAHYGSDGERDTQREAESRPIADKIIEAYTHQYYQTDLKIFDTI